MGLPHSADMSVAEKDRVVIVTGAGQGIGFEICRRLATGGARILLNDRDEPLAEQAAETLRREGLACHACAGDVASAAFNQQMVEEALRLHGRLDGVVANAGITLFQDFFEVRPEDFQLLMNTNLGGCFFLAQAAGRYFRESGAGGSMVFMSSVTGLTACQNLSVYSSSKAAIQMLARHLVVEFSPMGVNVNAVAPGATLTERTAQDEGYERNWSVTTPMGRPAYPADIAAAVAFLMSPEARHITGQTLIVDGGWTSLSPPSESR